MELLFAIVSPLLVVLTGVLFSASLRLPTKSAKLISIFVIAFAEIVLIGEILGSTYALSNRALWLLLQLIALTVSVAMWWRSGRPVLNFRFSWSRAELLNSMRQYPVLWVLGLCVGLTYLFGALLVLYVPPNNHDGLAYHLTRVGYWLQFDSLFPWKTFDGRQTSFPINAEIGVLWTILVRGTEQFAGFVQWLSALVSAVAIFGMGRLFGYSRAQSTFPPLIYLTLSQVYLQSTTIQNDLVVSAFFISALYLLLIGIRTRHYGALLISSICIGLSVGTKSTAMFILPGLACAACLLWLQDIRGRFKLFLVWGGVCLISIVIWGAYIYVINALAFGHPLGAENLWKNHSATSDTINNVEISYSRLDLLAINGPRYFSQMFDFSSLGEVGQEFTRAKYDLFNRVFEDTYTAKAWMHGGWDWLTSQTVLWGPNEDTSWFGVLGFALFLPGIGYGIYLWVKQRNVVMLGIALLPIVFWILHSAAQPYTPAKGRYYVLPITAGAVLMIWPMVSNRLGWRILRLIFVFLAIVTGVNNIIFNENKSLVGSQSIINQDRLQRQGRNVEMDHFLKALETFVPKDAQVILLIPDSPVAYSVFGEFLTRYVVPAVVDRKVEHTFEKLRSNPPVFLIGRQETHTPEERANYILIDAAILQQTDYDTTGFEEITSGLNIVVYRALDAIEEEIQQLRYEFDGTTPGSGWDLPTLTGDVITSQWSSRPVATLGTVRLSTANNYEVRLRIESYLDQEIIDSLALLANDSVIPIFRLLGNEFWGIIPKEVIESGQGLLRLTLKTDRITSLHELGLSGDTRPKGVAVDWLTVEPTNIGTSIRAEFDGQYPTDGFQQPEIGVYNLQTYDFQWSAAAESRITLPLIVEGAGKLQFFIRTEMTVGSIENLSLTVDGRRVEYTVEKTAEGTLFTALIPEIPNNYGLITVAFETIEPTSPNALNYSPDLRLLGFALDWLTIEPLSATP